METKYYLVTLRAISTPLNYEKVWWETIDYSPFKLLMGYERTKGNFSQYAILNVLEITKEEYDDSKF